MTKYLTLFVFLIVGFFIWLFFNKESGHEQQLKSLIEKHKIEMDSSKEVAEQWRLKALEYGNQFRKEATRAMKAENNYIYALEENRRLKNRPVIKYTNSQLDSLLSARYDR